MPDQRLLMIAYHFPPLAGSSGIQRTLRFVQHLPALGWQPLVLTTNERAYEQTAPDQLQAIPSGTVVRRAFALDTARHLSVGGRYIAAMARPDRWISWKFDGVRQGLQMIRAHAPSAIWSTYPFATAHLIGRELARRTGLPWIADFRDPMAQPGYPEDPVTRAQFLRIEEQTIREATLSTFTTPSAVAEYQRRYPACASRITLLENGYDEETFSQALDAAALGPLNPGITTILHSGIVYPSERDPTQLFEALAMLKHRGEISDGRLKVRFRAPVAAELLNSLAEKWKIQDCIEILPSIGYRDALSEMLRADGLLVMQASNCNQQIPAKLYEYLRCGRPILGLTDPSGDTALTLRQAGIQAIAQLDHAAGIAELISRFRRSDASLSTMPIADAVMAASRRRRAQELARHLDALTIKPIKAAQLELVRP